MGAEARVRGSGGVAADLAERITKCCRKGETKTNGIGARERKELKKPDLRIILS